MSNGVSLNLRDFIYLDVDRVKSILAQIDRGLLTDRSDSSSSSKSVEGKTGLSIPTLFEVGGAGQYMTTDQSTETRTLHDFVYNETEEKLIVLNRLMVVPDDFTSKAILNEEFRAKLSPVEYVLVRGRVSLDDYAYMKMLLDNYNEIIRTVIEFSYDQTLNSASGNQKAIIRKQIESEISKASLDKSYVKKLRHLFDIFTGDRLAITVAPFPDEPDIRIVGPLQHQLLRECLEDVRFKFGTQPGSNWTVFGQIAAIPRKEEQRSGFEFTYSNDLNRAINTLFDSIRVVEDQFRITYPEIAITPIAIYRE